QGHRDTGMADLDHDSRFGDEIAFRALAVRSQPQETSGIGAEIASVPTATLFSGEFDQTFGPVDPAQRVVAFRRRDEQAAAGGSYDRAVERSSAEIENQDAAVVVDQAAGPPEMGKGSGNRLRQ